MERYSGAQTMEGASEADSMAEWTAPSGETGLEEPMWQLGIGGGPESYPERPEAADCMYYLRTGYCGYGARCRFNHPRDRSVVMGAMRASRGEYPDRVGQPVCQYYMKTGMCKFGASCKYHHPKQGVGPQSPAGLTIHGYPLRPGEKECSYYVKTGQCKFGVTCKFHHPQPAGVQITAPVPGPIIPAPTPLPAPSVYPTMQPPLQSSQPYGVVAGNWPVARPTLLPGSYMPGTYGPMLLPTGMVPVPGWTSYPAPVSPVASASTPPTIGATPVYGLTQLSPSAPAYTGQYVSVPPTSAGSSNNQEKAFPERPGQIECQYYMRTGDCKFGASCRYHHPPEWSSLLKANFALSPMGLPLRPEAPICTHYAQNGVCKFGPSCKYNHPMGTLSYSPSASSLADMPVAPYPVGSSMATLAPSSSSSDLRPELLSGSTKDTFSSRMSYLGTSSSSVGSLFSKSATVPHSTTMPSGSTTSDVRTSS